MVIVDQVSMPMRILLAVTLAFAAIWFAALRPKPADDVAPPAPAPAAAATATADPAVPATAPADTAPVATAPAAPATAPITPARPATARPRREVRRVLDAIEQRKTVVLLFAGDGADDRSVRRAVRRADRHGGKVSVHVASIERLADYEPVVRGLPVQHAPTVLVIDRTRQASAITGLTVTGEIDQTVDRALKAKPGATPAAAAPAPVAPAAPAPTAAP
jgi:hypothetical protein